MFSHRFPVFGTNSLSRVGKVRKRFAAVTFEAGIFEVENFFFRDFTGNSMRPLLRSKLQEALNFQKDINTWKSFQPIVEQILCE